MRFSKAKLPRAAAMQLRRCPVESVSAFAFTLSPMYVYLKKNQKFISVKGPLDFFTAEELDKFRTYKNFYVTSFVDQVIPFRDAALSIMALMNWNPKIPASSTVYPVVPLPVSPYELNDAILQILAPLWGPQLSVEPFFIAVFANELCALLPAEELMKAKSGDYERFETAVLRSGAAVFLALNLGWADQDFLNRLRLRVFQETHAGIAHPYNGVEVDEVIALADRLVIGPYRGEIENLRLQSHQCRPALKIVRRLKRVLSEPLVEKDQEKASIYGIRGFIDEL